ncbi:hypothetical protein A2U01_0030067, partial [Trifolium medium]|nr:hypothetical protein [Trifolium medium]
MSTIVDMIVTVHHMQWIHSLYAHDLTGSLDSSQRRHHPKCKLLPAVTDGPFSTVIHRNYLKSHRQNHLVMFIAEQYLYTNELVQI